MLRRIPFYLFAAVLLFCATTRAETLSPYNVKAACLYNFLKFVEWPPQSLPKDDPYIVGVLGKDPFGAILDSTMTGKTINGRRIVVMRMTVSQIRQAHLLFICPSERKRYRQVIAGLGDAPVLTVGETPDFAEMGGMIEFFIENNKVRFQINADAAKTANLHIAAPLLSLGQVAQSR